jgi:putative FmdB family regulatory protein
MPTYDYVCDACGHAFEEFQYIKEKPLRKCPECGKLKLRRLIGAGAAVVFKGSGFYQTDYRSESYKKGESTAKSSNTGGSSSSDSDKKSDAAKSDSKAGVSDKASTGSKS